MNLADFLTQQAEANPQALAIIDGGQRLNYADLEGLTWGLCRHFHDAGLRDGDVVGLHVRNPLLLLATVFALARSGVVNVTLSTDANASASQVSLLERTTARAVIDDGIDRDWGSRARVHVEPTMATTLRGGPDRTLRVDDDGALLMYSNSSGTTGVPKIFGITHGGAMASLLAEIEGIGYRAGERYLSVVSPAYAAPRRRYLCCLAAGGTAVMPPPDGGLVAIGELIHRHDVRHFSCVPSQAFAMALAVPEGTGPRFPHVRCLRLSAGPSEGALHRLVRERLTPNLMVSYGCNELGPLTVAPPAMLAKHPDTVGRPIKGVDVEVVGVDDQVLPVGQVGQIRLRAPGMPSCYRDDDTATAKSFRGGWFYPGDLGRWNADAVLCHMGRADDLMIMNGINIYPAEIEQAMTVHPAVREAVAFPLKHPIRNDVPVCAVVVSDEAKVSEEDLLGFSRQRLGSHSPRRVVILSAIPRNETGKVLRAELREAAFAWMKANDLSPARLLLSLRDATVDRQGQLSVDANVSYVLPENASLEQLDAWLVDVLHLDVREYRVPEVDKTPGIERLAHAWLWRALLLSRRLFQDGRVPVFDSPRILANHRNPALIGGWQARVAYPRVDELPPVAFNVVFNGALNLCAWAMERPVDTRGLQQFFDMIQKGILQRLSTLWRNGKSTFQVLRVVHGRSIPFTHLGAGVFQLGWGSRARRIDRSVTDDVSAIGPRLANDKGLTASLLRRACLPAPVHAVVFDWQGALSAARQLDWPVVVKPADRERGEGVAVDVGSDDSLKQAFESALALSRTKKVIVERQVVGVCHRLFVAHGRLLYAVKRLPMSVTGDGVSEVARLIDAEVARQMRLPPWDRSGIRPMDDLARAAMARAGFSPTSVPANGELVPLRRIESTEWGGVDEDVTTRVHPDNLKAALAASELFGLAVAGIDIISADIGQPWYANGAIINEVNHAPLLGGGDISRSHIPAFLDELVEGNGMIPVEVFVGGRAAMGPARRRWQERVASGQAAYLSHARQTVEPSGAIWHMPFNGLYRRTRALVLSPRVQAMVLVVQTDEFLTTGLPLEAVSAVTVVDQSVASTQSGGASVSRERLDLLIQLLQNWTGKSADDRPSR